MQGNDEEEVCSSSTGQKSSKIDDSLNYGQSAREEGCEIRNWKEGGPMKPNTVFMLEPAPVQKSSMC
jgi:hypothetical protein